MATSSCSTPRLRRRSLARVLPVGSPDRDPRHSSDAGRRASPAALGLRFVDALLPAASDRAIDAEALDVRLDVEKWRSVEHVNVGDVEDATLPPKQPDDAHPDRVRPRRCPRGEDTSWHIVEERHDLKSTRLGPVEMEEQDDVREAIEVIEAFCEGRIDLDPPLDPPRILRLDRAFCRIRVRCSDDADRPVAYRFSPACHDSPSMRANSARSKLGRSEESARTPASRQKLRQLGVIKLRRRSTQGRQTDGRAFRVPRDR